MIVSGGISETVTVMLGRIVVMLCWVSVTVLVKFAVIVVTRLNRLGAIWFTTRLPARGPNVDGTSSDMTVLAAIMTMMLLTMKCLVCYDVSFRRPVIFSVTFTTGADSGVTTTVLTMAVAELVTILVAVTILESMSTA